MECKHRKVDYFVTQVLSGHGVFGSCAKRFRKTTSENCIYCGEIDTAQHTAFDCLTIMYVSVTTGRQPPSCTLFRRLLTRLKTITQYIKHNGDFVLKYLILFLRIIECTNIWTNNKNYVRSTLIGLNSNILSFILPNNIHTTPCCPCFLSPEYNIVKFFLSILPYPSHLISCRAAISTLCICSAAIFNILPTSKIYLSQEIIHLKWAKIVRYF